MERKRVYPRIEIGTIENKDCIYFNKDDFSCTSPFEHVLKEKDYNGKLTPDCIRVNNPIIRNFSDDQVEALLEYMELLKP